MIQRRYAECSEARNNLYDVHENHQLFEMRYWAGEGIKKKGQGVIDSWNAVCQLDCHLKDLNTSIELAGEKLEEVHDLLCDHIENFDSDELPSEIISIRDLINEARDSLDIDSENENIESEDLDNFEG